MDWEVTTPPQYEYHWCKACMWEESLEERKQGIVANNGSQGNGGSNTNPYVVLKDCRSEEL